MSFGSSSPEKNWENDLSYISVKDEPLGLLDSSLNDLKTEPEDVDTFVSLEPKVLTQDSEVNTSGGIGEDRTISPASNVGSPNKNANAIVGGRVPVTRKLIINGQEKVCLLVNNSQFKQNALDNIEKLRQTTNNQSPKKSTSCTENTPDSMITCSRCCLPISINSFKHNIETCPCKTLVNNKNSSHNQGNAIPQATQNHTTQVMYNPSTGEVITLGVNRTTPSVQVPKNDENGTINWISGQKESATIQNSPVNYCFTNVGFQCNSGTSLLLNNVYSQRAMNNFPSSQNEASSSIRFNKIPNRKTILYCSKCDFSSSTAIIMNIHMKKHVDMVTTQKNDSTEIISGNDKSNSEVTRTDSNKTVSLKSSYSSNIDKTRGGNATEIPVEPIMKSTLNCHILNGTFLVPTERTRSVLKPKSKIATATSEHPDTVQDIVASIWPRSKSLDARHFAEIPNETAPANKDGNSTSLVLESPSRRTGTTEKLGDIERPPIVPRHCQKTGNDSTQKDQGFGSANCSTDLCDENIISKSTQNLGDNGKKASTTSMNDNSNSIPNMSGNSNGSSNSNHVNNIENSRTTPVARTVVHGIFPCSTCSYVTYNKPDLEAHERDHIRANLPERAFLDNEYFEYMEDDSETHSEDRLHTSSPHLLALTNFYTDSYYLYDEPPADTSNNLLLLENNTLSCSTCSFTTDKRQTLKDHERNHRRTNLPIFQCTYCNQRYTKNNLHLHVQTVHPGLKFQMPEEPKEAIPNKPESPTCLTGEEIVAADPVPRQRHTCCICPFSTTQQKHLTAHVMNHNFQPISSSTFTGVPNDLVFGCPYCSYRHNSKYKIVRHFKTHMNNQPIKKCLKCDFKSTPRALLFHHTQKCGIELPKSGWSHKRPAPSFPTAKRATSHTTKPFKQTERSGHLFFKCNMCSYGTKSRCDIGHHAVAHKKNTPIMKCSNCNYKSTKRALKFHMKICKTNSASASVNDNKDVSPKSSPTDKSCDPFFECDMCSYRTKNRRDIVRHVELHAKNMPIMKCFNCNYKSTKRALHYHMKNCKLKSETAVVNDCEGISPKSSGFDVGSVCSSPTTKHVTLQSDTKMHFKQTEESGDLFFECDMCSYRTKNRGDIVRHVGLHAKNMPIMKCFNCNYKSTKRALQYHMKNCKLKSETAVVNDCEGISPKSSGFDVGSVCSSPTTKHVTLQSDTKMHFKQTEESGDLFFECDMCSYRTKIRGDIVRHVGLHAKNMPIMKCFNCNYKSTKRALQYHMKNCKLKSETEIVNNSEGISSKSSGLNKAPACSFSTTKHATLQLDTKKPFKQTDKSGDPFFECNMCSYGTRRRYHMVVHVRLHAKNMLIMKCFNCNYKSTTHALQRHMRNCKPKAQTAIGNNSEGISPKSSGLSKGPAGSFPTTKQATLLLDTKKHFKETDKSGCKFFECNMCSYGAKTRYDIVKHIERHKNNMPIVKCSNCNYKSSKYLLQLHMRNCKPNSESANLNDSKFISESNEVKSDQKSLIVRITPITLFKCSQCSFCTSLRIKLKLHSRKCHLNVYKCKLCSFNSTLFQSYSRHMQKHVRNKVYKCKFCSFSSTKSQSHNSHMKKHQGTSKSITILPNAESSNKVVDNLKNDVKEIRKSIQCSKCPFTTSLRVKLNFHMREYHQETNSKQEKSKTLSTSDKDVSNQPKSKLACQYCSYTAQRLSHLYSHMTRHKTRHTKRCSNCSFKATPIALSFHMSQCVKTQHIREVVNITETNRDKSPCETNKVRLSDSANNKKEMLWNCSLCSYIAASKVSFLKHKRAHETRPTKQCPSCSYRATPIALSIHMSQCAGTQHTREVAITSSNKTTKHDNKTNKVDSHRLLGKGEVLTRCFLCSYIPRSKGDFRYHIRAHKTNPTKQCSNCNYKATPRALGYHMQLCSRSKAMSKNQSNEISQKDDGEKNLSPKTKPASPKTFTCEYCSFSSFWSYLIERHVNSHTVLKLPISQCEKCDFRSTPAALSAHINACTGKSRDTTSLTRTQPVDKVDKRGIKVANSSGRKMHEMRHKNGRFKIKETHDKPKISKVKSKNNSKRVKYTTVDDMTDTPKSNCSPKSVFSCPMCPFATNLRIKLKFHFKNKH